jgi:acetyl esterase/lipase
MNTLLERVEPQYVGISNTKQIRERENYLNGEYLMVVKTQKCLHYIPWVVGFVWHVCFLALSVAGPVYMLGWIVELESIQQQGWCDQVRYFETYSNHTLLTVALSFVAYLMCSKPIYFPKLYKFQLGDSVYPLFAIPLIADQLSLYIQAHYKKIVGANVGYSLGSLFFWFRVLVINIEQDRKGTSSTTPCVIHARDKFLVTGVCVILGCHLLLTLLYGMWYRCHVLATCYKNQLRLKESNNPHWNMFCEAFNSITVAGNQNTNKNTSLIPKTQHNQWTPTRGQICISRDIVFDSVYCQSTTSHTRQCKTTRLCLMLDVYRPTTAALLQHKLPVVIHIHGGGFMKGHRRDISRVFLNAVMKSGCVLVSPEYRLAPHASVKEQVNDILACLAWIENTGQFVFNIDPTRVTVAGSSSGAFVAILVSLKHNRSALLAVNTDNTDTIQTSIATMSQTNIIGYIGLYGLFTASDSVTRDMFKHTVLQTANNRCNDLAWLESSPEWWSSSLSSVIQDVKTQTRNTKNSSKSRDSLARHAYLSTFLVHGTHDAVTGFKQAQLFHQTMLRDNPGNFHGFLPIEHGHHAFDFVSDARSELVTDGIHLYLVWNNQQCKNVTAAHWVQNIEDRNLHNANETRVFGVHKRTGF